MWAALLSRVLREVGGVYEAANLSGSRGFEVLAASAVSHRSAFDIQATLQEARCASRGVVGSLAARTL